MRIKRASSDDLRHRCGRDGQISGLLLPFFPALSGRAVSSLQKTLAFTLSSRISLSPRGDSGYHHRHLHFPSLKTKTTGPVMRQYRDRLGWKEKRNKKQPSECVLLIFQGPSHLSPLHGGGVIFIFYFFIFRSFPRYGKSSLKRKIKHSQPD